jgi:hypothetical protein
VRLNRQPDVTAALAALPGRPPQLRLTLGGLSYTLADRLVDAVEGLRLPSRTSTDPRQESR